MNSHLIILPSILLAHRSPLILAIVLFLSFGVTHENVRAESDDVRFLAGLRQRQLFTLAEAYCRRQLGRSDLDPARQVELTVELARTLAEHAVQSETGERDTKFAAAHRALADFQQGFSNHPRVLLAQLQDSLTWLAQGELARQEAEVVARSAPLFESARADLGRAIRGLETIDRELEVMLRRRYQQGRAQPGEFTAVELEALRRNVSFQLARAFRNQGACYPADSADRTNALAQAVERLTALAELAEADEFVWRSRIDCVACLRLLGYLDRAGHALAEVLGSEPPADIALRAQAERIRLLIAAGRLDEAVEAASKKYTRDSLDSVDLDFARMEAFVAAVSKAGGGADRDGLAKLQQQATSQARQLGREHGPYWQRRANTMLAAAIGAVPHGDAEALAVAAEGLYASGQFAEAIAAYDRAAEQSTDPNRAFQLALTAAAIENQRKNFQQAGDRYRRIATTYVDHPRAAEAHLWAIVAATQLARRAEPDKQQRRLDEYAAMLDEHLVRWPQAPSADQVRLWQGRLHAARNAWPAAIKSFQGVDMTGPHAEQAVLGFVDAYERFLADPTLDADAQRQAAHQATEFLHGTIRRRTGDWPERWSPVERLCAVAAARIMLEHLPDEGDSAERILAAALRGSDDADDDWKSRARALLVHALAAQSRFDAARNVIDGMATGSAESLASLVEALDDLAGNATQQQRADLAPVTLQAARLLEPRLGELSATQRRNVATARAAALVDVGELAAAESAYETLAGKYPDDGDIQEAWARFLSNSSDEARRRRALARWRDVEKKSPRGSPRWFRARLTMAEIYVQLGEPAKAVKLIKLTKILQPGLGGAKSQAAFERLLERIEN